MNATDKSTLRIHRTAFLMHSKCEKGPSQSEARQRNFRVPNPCFSVLVPGTSCHATHFWRVR